MDEKLKATLLKIKQLSEQNEEFANEMRKMFGKTSPAQVVYKDGKVEKDITIIREALDIRANNSIDYSFVDDQHTRDQLLIDNLRMENARLVLRGNETERIYNFCVNAFYQVENIINYFLYKQFPDAKTLNDKLEEYTKYNYEYKITGYGYQTDFRYKRKDIDKYNEIDKIDIVAKANATSYMLFPKDSKFYWFLTHLRQLRNDSSHRCQVIMSDENIDKSLSNFLKNNTIVTTRDNLKRLVFSIRDVINGTSVLYPSSAIVTKKVGKIISKSSDNIQVEIENKKQNLPLMISEKLQNKKEGEEIAFIYRFGKLLDIAEN